MSVGNIPNENESLELLHGMMGESFDADVARRVLKKFGGDLNQAAAAIIEGDTGESALSSWQKGPISQVNYNSQASGSSSGALNAPQRTNTPCPPDGLSIALVLPELADLHTQKVKKRRKSLT